MKAQMKAVVASAVVIVLALAAVSGVTYSWFSDSESTDVSITTSEIEIDISFNGQDFGDTDVTAEDNDTLTDWAGENRDIFFYMKNESTSDIVYRTTVKATLVDNGNDVTGNYSGNGTDDPLVDAIKINGENAFELVTVNGATHYITSPVDLDWATWGKDSGETTRTLAFSLSFEPGEGETGDLNGLGLRFDLTTVAYPADYKQTNAVDSDGKITIDSDDITPAGVTVTGTATYGTGDDAKEIGFSVSFNKTAANSITDGDGEVIIKAATVDLNSYESVAGDEVVAAIDVDVPDSDMGGGLATVTVTIPGTHTGLVIRHQESTDCIYPTVSYTGGDTVVTFTAEHFSTYIVESGAPYTVVTDGSTLDTALSAGGTVVLGSDIELSETIISPEGKESILDLNGYKITGLTTEDGNKHIYALDNHGDLTIRDSKGCGSIEARGIYNGYNGGNPISEAVMTIDGGRFVGSDTDGGYVIGNYGKLTINNGTFLAYEDDPSDKASSGNTDATCLYNGGTATINGGTFESTTNFTYAIQSSGTLVIPDDSYVSITGAHGVIHVSGGTASIDGGDFTCMGVSGSSDHVFYLPVGAVSITGGTFVHERGGINGSSIAWIGSEGSFTVSGGTFSLKLPESCVAEGCIQYETQDGKHIVINDMEAVVVSSDELASAIEGGLTKIMLLGGTYNIPDSAKGKTLNLTGIGPETIVEVVPAGQGEANGQLDYSLDGSEVTFNNLTVKTNSQLYAGYARLSGTYYDCVIQNTYNLGVGDSAFYGCTFDITDEYLRVGGAYSAVFEGCTFNTDGRAILVFQDGTSCAQTVIVKNCIFNATAAAHTWNGIHVAAVSIDGTNGTCVVNLEGTNTVDNDFNGLWQIKTGDANVTVNE